MTERQTLVIKIDLEEVKILKNLIVQPVEESLTVVSDPVYFWHLGTPPLFLSLMCRSPEGPDLLPPGPLCAPIGIYMHLTDEDHGPADTNSPNVPVPPIVPK